jgi:hypothetical protein
MDGLSEYQKNVVVAPASFSCHMMMMLLSQPRADDIVVSASCYC